MFNYIVRGTGGDTPYELICERLCKKYGWTLREVRELSIDDINLLLDIATCDNEAQKRTSTNIKEEDS